MIFCLSAILLFSCNEKHKNVENNLNKSEYSSANNSETELKSTTNEKEIVPGKSLGKILLNENATAILDSLGKPDFGDAAMGKAISTWNKGDGNLLTLYTSTQMGVENFSRIKAIRSLSKNFKTVDNLGVSSSLDDLKKYYRLTPIGKFTFNGKHYFLYTTPKGIAFEIGMDQKCNGILLYLQDTDPENFYIPIYPDFKKL